MLDYSAVVPSHLEYCVQTWLHSLSKDLNKLERLQSAATRLFLDLCGLSYETRLDRLKLFSLDEFVENKFRCITTR